MEMDIYSFGDITAALQSAQAGDTLLLNIKNNIIFTNTALINKSITINLINGSGDETVALTIADGGTFRHFGTGGASIDNITMTVGPGIILDGLETVRFCRSATSGQNVQRSVRQAWRNTRHCTAFFVDRQAVGFFCI